MGKTRIPYATDTWNPVTGCSPDRYNLGCRERCWAARQARRLPKTHGGYSATGYSTGPVAIPFSRLVLHEDRLDQPLHWRKARVVFVATMGDLFHDQVPDEFIEQVFLVMGRRYYGYGKPAQRITHTWLVFTKRAERMKAVVSALVARRITWREGMTGDLPPNIWLFVSASTQAEVDERVPLLLQTPAAHRGLCLEPLLEDVSLATRTGHWSYLKSLDQVIAGCESGPGARKAKCAWFRSIQDQCREGGVPCYVKQVSGEEGEPQVIRFKPEPGNLAWEV